MGRKWCGSRTGCALRILGIFVVGCGLICALLLARERSQREEQILSVQIGLVRLRGAFTVVADLVERIRTETGAYPKSDDSMSIGILEKTGPYADVAGLWRDLVDPYSPVLRWQNVSDPDRQAGLARESALHYISNGKEFIVISCGPDRVYETDSWWGIAERFDTVTTEDMDNVVKQLSYDPSNGSRSRGDLFFTSPALGVASHRLVDMINNVDLPPRR